jgi:hypothetical protein
MVPVELNTARAGQTIVFVAENRPWPNAQTVELPSAMTAAASAAASPFVPLAMNIMLLALADENRPSRSTMRPRVAPPHSGSTSCKRDRLRASAWKRCHLPSGS